MVLFDTIKSAIPIIYLTVAFVGIQSNPGLELMSRIYDGSNSDGYPFFVGLGLASNSYEEDRDIFCAGSLITPIHVVTAGHCVVGNEDLIHSELLLGTATQITDAPIRRTISKIFVAPNYYYSSSKSGILNGDIAIIQMNKPVSFAPNIGRICISKTKFDEQPVTLIGYGRTDGRNAAKHLKIAYGTTTPCKDKYATSLNICARLNNDEGRKAEEAEGDSGGPLFTMSNKKNTLVGIVSYNVKLKEDRYGRRLPAFAFPGAYTRVSKYVDWIHSVTKEQGDKYAIDTDC